MSRLLNDAGSPVIIFTDGSYNKDRGGVGGHAAILRFTQGGDAKTYAVIGATTGTTNNRMEMTAAITALRALSNPTEVQVFSDSQYLVWGITRWIHGWILHGTVKEKANSDLWEELLVEGKRHCITWGWVQAHVGQPDNEIVDKLARAAMNRIKDSEPMETFLEVEEVYSVR